MPMRFMNGAQKLLLASVAGLCLMGLQPSPAFPESDNIKSVEARLRIYAEALFSFKYDVGRYPTTTEGLEALRSQPPTAPNWQGPYRSRISPDSWGNKYIYAFPRDKCEQARSGRYQAEYDLYSLGPNLNNDNCAGDDISLPPLPLCRERP